VTMKEKAKCAAAVVKKQLQSCCPYGRLLDREELEDVEKGRHLHDHAGDASVTSSCLHHHAVCVPKVINDQVVVATKSSSMEQQPIMHSSSKIIQGTMPIISSSSSTGGSSRLKVLQSPATTNCKKLYTTFNPWSVVKPPAKPLGELQIFSPLYAQSSSSLLRPADAPEIQIPSSCSPPTSQAIRLESNNALVDSATTLSIDFSPISDDSSQIYCQLESRWESPTRLQQQEHTSTTKHAFVPQVPLFHPSFEIASNQGLEESPGASTSPLSYYSSQHLKSKLSRQCVSRGDDESLPNILQAAFPAPAASSSSTCGHGSKCSSLTQRISKDTTAHAAPAGPPPPPAAASPGRAGGLLRNVIHPTNKSSLKLPVIENIPQTGLDTRRGSRGFRGRLKFHEKSHATKLGTQEPVITTTTVVSSSSCEAGPGGHGGPVQSPHSHGSATISASGPISNGSLPSYGGHQLLLQHHPENEVDIRIPAQSSHYYSSVEDVTVPDAAVKKVRSFRDYPSGHHTETKRNTSDGTPVSSSCYDALVPVRLLSQELKKEGISIGTQTSKTETQSCVKKPQQQQQQQQQQPAVAPMTPAITAAPKAWNASIHTAQDYKAILQRKQEAAMKRDRALQYALSHQHWKKSSKLHRPIGWSTEQDEGILDKAGWIWNWLERAARLGVHGSTQEPIFDNSFSLGRDPQSESLSVKSSVGICTTELGSCGKNNVHHHHHLQDHQQTPVGWCNPDQWPLSLRQQHAAGLFQARHHDDTIPQEDTVAAAKPSHLLKPKPAGPPVSTAILAAGTELILKANTTSTSLHHQNQCPTHKTDVVQKPDILEKGFSFTATDDHDHDHEAEEEDDQSCVPPPPPPQSDHGTSSRNGHGGVMRKLKFGTKSLQQESVGSCCVAGE